MRSSDVTAGNTIYASDLNKLRDDAFASSWLLAHEQTVPDLTLKVENGTIYFGVTPIVFAGGNSPSFTAPSTNPRIDILSLDNTGTLIRTVGTESVSPTEPDVPVGNIPICQIYNRVGQTTIRDTDITGQGYILKDIRPFLLKRKLPTQQIFTSSGTWNKPVGLTYVTVELVAPGGGGGGSGSSGGTGTDGGNVSFGSHCSATGGSCGIRKGKGGLGGIGSGGDLNLKGQTGVDSSPRDSNGFLAPGGNSFFGKSGGNGAAPGGASGSSIGSGSGGGAGGYSRKTIHESSLGTTETVTIGSVGTGGVGTGTGGGTGENGESGFVIVTEYY